MLYRYYFFVIFGVLLAGLTWWSKALDTTAVREVAPIPQASGSSAVEPHFVSSSGLSPAGRGWTERHRLELLETLDGIVAYEHYYRSVYSHFTKFLGRIGYPIPASLTSQYEFRVLEASADRFQVSAVSEENGKTVELVSIDQDYQIQASFRLPAPRAEYLRLHALRHLRQLYDAPPAQLVDEQGVFRGYFRYDVRMDARDRKRVFARGVRPPVTGLQLQYSGDVDFTAGLSPEFSEGGELQVGEKPSDGWGGAEVSEQAVRVQKMFRSDVGRYARSWLELSRITGVGRVDSAPVVAPGVPKESSRAPAGSQVAVPKPAPDAAPLEIEPIFPAVPAKAR